MKKILFTGGGSAGHVVPNLAIIEEVKNEADICYMGTDGLEKNLVAPLKIPYWEISCPKFVRSFSLKNFKIPGGVPPRGKKGRGRPESLPPRHCIFQGRLCGSARRIRG